MINPTRIIDSLSVDSTQVFFLTGIEFSNITNYHQQLKENQKSMKKKI